MAKVFGRYQIEVDGKVYKTLKSFLLDYKSTERILLNKFKQLNLVYGKPQQFNYKGLVITITGL